MNMSLEISQWAALRCGLSSVLASRLPPCLSSRSAFPQWWAVMWKRKTIKPFLLMLLLAMVFIIIIESKWGHIVKTEFPRREIHLIFIINTLFYYNRALYWFSWDGVLQCYGGWFQTPGLKQSFCLSLLNS